MAKAKVAEPKAKKDLVATISKKVSPIVSEVQLLSIKKQEDMPAAVSLLSKLNVLNDRIIEDREKITKPLNAALKEVRGKYKPLESALEEAIDLIRGKMSTFQTEQLRLKKAAEAEEAAKVASGEVSLEEGVEALQEAPKEVANVATKEGEVTFKTLQKLKIINPDLIPRNFLLINEKLVLDTLKAGTAVAGAEIEEVQVPINYRG